MYRSLPFCHNCMYVVKLLWRMAYIHSSFTKATSAMETGTERLLIAPIRQKAHFRAQSVWRQPGRMKRNVPSSHPASSSSALPR